MQEALKEYIDKMLAKGVDPGRIVELLVDHNWKKDQVEALVLTQARNRLGDDLKHPEVDVHPKAAIPAEGKEDEHRHVHDHLKTGKKFIYLLAIITLVMIIILFALLKNAGNSNPNPVGPDIKEQTQANIRANFCKVGEVWTGYDSGERLINRIKDDYGGVLRCRASSNKDPNNGYYYFDYNDVVYKIVNKTIPFEENLTYLAAEKVR